VRGPRGNGVLFSCASFWGFVNKELRAGDTAAPFGVVLLEDRLGSHESFEEGLVRELRDALREVGHTPQYPRNHALNRSKSGLESNLTGGHDRFERGDTRRGRERPVRWIDVCYILGRSLPLSPRIVALKEILRKLRPEPAREAPLPPPRHYELPSRGRYRSRR
jgi:hypothetical protein